jgi:hypothetical protein
MNNAAPAGWVCSKLSTCGAVFREVALHGSVLPPYLNKAELLTLLIKACSLTKLQGERKENRNICAAAHILRSSGVDQY